MNESWVKCAKSRTALGMGVEAIGTVVALGISGMRNSSYWPPVVSIFFQAVIVRSRPGTTTLKCRIVGAQRFSCCFLGLKLFVLVCPAFQSYVHYPISAKRTLSELRRLDSLPPPALYILIPRWYLQHEKWDWLGSHSLRFYVYRISSKYDLKYMVPCS